MKKGRSNDNNNNHDNKYCSRNCCPCKDLGPYLPSRYETINMLSDDGDSIIAPEYEYTSDQYKRKSGQIFVNVDSIGEKLAEAFTRILKGEL